MTIPSFDDYLASLTNLGTTADPTIDTPEGLAIKAAAQSIADLGEVTEVALAELAAPKRPWPTTMTHENDGGGR